MMELKLDPRRDALRLRWLAENIAEAFDGDDAAAALNMRAVREKFREARSEVEPLDALRHAIDHLLPPREMKEGQLFVHVNLWAERVVLSTPLGERIEVDSDTSRELRYALSKAECAIAHRDRIQANLAMYEAAETMLEALELAAGALAGADASRQPAYEAVAAAILAAKG